MVKQQIKTREKGLSPWVEMQKDLTDAVTINHSPAKVFEFIANFENYPLFMKGLIEVKRLDSTKFRWVIGGRAGTLLEWETKIVQEIPGAMVKWESVAGSKVKQTGTFVVSRASGGRGTVVQMAFEDSLTPSQYREIFEDLTLDSDIEVSAHTNLRRLKSYIECGEVATTEGQSTGRGTDSEKIKH